MRDYFEASSVTRNKPETTTMANEHLKSKPQDNLPYIDFLRSYNEHMPDEKLNVPWKLVLFDKHGGPHCWVDPSQVQYYVDKGFKIVGYGNFDIRKPDGSRWKELVDIEGIVKSFSEAHSALLSARAEVAAMKEKAGAEKGGDAGSKAARG